MESRLRGLGGDYSGESREGTIGTTSGNTADVRCARRREEWDAQKDSGCDIVGSLYGSAPASAACSRGDALSYGQAWSISILLGCSLAQQCPSRPSRVRGWVAKTRSSRTRAIIRGLNKKGSAGIRHQHSVGGALLKAHEGVNE